MLLGGPLPRSSCFGTRLPRKRNVHSYSKLCSKEFLKQWLLEEPIFLTVFFLLFRQLFRHFLPHGVILPLGKAEVGTLTWSSKLIWYFKYTKIIPASGVQIFKFSKLFILSFSWIWNDKNISSKAFSYFKISNLWLIQSIINPWWCWELPKA